MASKLFVAGFFTFHYGLFTLVHGIFILAFAGGAMDGLTAPFGRLLDSPGLEWGRILLVWCIATAVQVAVALIEVLLERRLSPPPAPTTWSPTTG